MSLVVRNLVKSYGDKVVVDNLSFEMEKPGVYALLVPTEPVRPQLSE